jgi:hypothetical protein
MQETKNTRKFFKKLKIKHYLKIKNYKIKNFEFTQSSYLPSFAKHHLGHLHH